MKNKTKQNCRLRYWTIKEKSAHSAIVISQCSMTLSGCWNVGTQTVSDVVPTALLHVLMVSWSRGTWFFWLKLLFLHHITMWEADVVEECTGQCNFSSRALNNVARHLAFICPKVLSMMLWALACTVLNLSCIIPCNGLRNGARMLMGCSKQGYPPSPKRK